MLNYIEKRWISTLNAYSMAKINGTMNFELHTKKIATMMTTSSTSQLRCWTTQIHEDVDIARQQRHLLATQGDLIGVSQNTGEIDLTCKLQSFHCVCCDAEITRTSVIHEERTYQACEWQFGNLRAREARFHLFGNCLLATTTACAGCCSVRLLTR